jgi:hypothetical protein
MVELRRPIRMPVSVIVKPSSLMWYISCQISALQSYAFKALQSLWHCEKQALAEPDYTTSNFRTLNIPQENHPVCTRRDCSHAFCSNSLYSPIPRAWMYFSWDTTGTLTNQYIIMQRLPGVSLLSGWKDYSEDERQIVANQLSSYFRQLRAPRPPYGQRICSVQGGPI